VRNSDPPLFSRCGSSGGTWPLEAKGYRITTPLPDSVNLAAGSDVQIAGVAKVGDSQYRKS